MRFSALALDLATTTGWAWHAQGMDRPFFGHFTLPGKPGEVGQPVDALERWLEDFYEQSMKAGVPVTHWFFEQQHIAKKINIETVYRLITLGGTVEKIAYQKFVERRLNWQQNPWCWSVPIQTWRKHFIGRGAGFKKTEDKKSYLPGEDPKQLAVEKCESFGWHTEIPDEAEACGILDYGLSLIGDENHPRPWRDDLLMKERERA